MSRQASRRALLGGLAALPALTTVPALAIALPAGGAHPDAVLLALAATIPALSERTRSLGRERDRIEEICFAQAGPAPERPACNPADFPDFRDFDRAMDVWQADYKARDARLVAAGKALGSNDAERAYDAAEDALLTACWTIEKTRATTLEGLIAKARVAQEQALPDLRDSVLDDLVAMGGQA